MVGIQIGKEQEERKREEEGLNFETTPWWNFVTIMGYADEELRSASLSSLSNCGLNPRGRRRRCYMRQGGLSKVASGGYIRAALAPTMEGVYAI